MNLFVDTNILVYAVHEESERHARAKEFVEARRAGEGFCVSWSILYEWLRVVTHPRVFARPLAPEAAQGFVQALVSDPAVDVLVETSFHGRFLQEVMADAPPLRGNIYHDVHTATLMREHGLSVIATADLHFRLFPFLKAVDPTAGSASPVGTA